MMKNLLMSRMATGLWLLLSSSMAPMVSAKDWEGQPYPYLYQFPLPIPPVKQPKMTITNPVTKKPIQYFEVVSKAFQQQIYPGLPATNLVGYDGMAPGPTFIIQRGTETVVRFINASPQNNISIHLHGSPSRAPWDGWAEDMTPVGKYKDYYYPNSQSGRMLWYHDHAVDITAVNAYFGQAGTYILHDPAEDALGLPSGYGVYDVPLVLSSKQYQRDGQLFSPAGETTSLYGDVVHVNGQPWPFFNVEPRKYRLRFLNAAISRSFILYFERAAAQGTRLPFNVIASDAGLLSAPANTTSMAISMAERYEVVVDFKPFAGQNVTLRSEAKIAADTPYLNTDKVMQFVVARAARSPDTSKLPASLRAVPTVPPRTTADHTFTFASQGGQWKINGVAFSDVNNRVLAKPARGAVEVWDLVNGGGGWSHPVHVHLVDFKVLSRSGGGGGSSSRGVQSYEAQGLKDVVWLNVGETVRVEAQYGPYAGEYMFHCHNLVHEDHEMMAAFNVTALEDIGYNGTSFADPLDPRWSARPVVAADFTTQAITAKVRSMALLTPYGETA